MFISLLKPISQNVACAQGAIHFLDLQVTSRLLEPYEHLTQILRARNLEILSK